MRLVVFRLSRALLLSLGVTIHLFGYAASDSSVLEHSKFWPEKVTVNIEVTGVKHGNSVKPGREWIFLRYQDGKCLLDLGHNGIHALNVEDTDILERVTKISEENFFPFQGLFTYRYTKSFYDPKTLRGFQLGDMDQFDYFVLFYFDYESGSNTAHILGDFIRNYAEKINAEIKLAVLLIPSNNIIADGALSDYIADGLVAPTATPFMLKGMMHTLKHDYEIKGDVVLIDKFGKIIEQFFLSKLDSRDLSEILKNTLEEEVVRLKPVKAEILDSRTKESKQ
jgi:hypothetical protein